MNQPLADEQVDFFRDNGYLVLPKVLDPELMAQTRDAWWDVAPPELKRDDPETWVGAFADSRYTFKYRDRSFERWMIDLLYGNPELQAVAKQLLGPELKVPERIRGIYCVFPDTDKQPRPAHFHVDAHAFNLGVVGYVDDVPPDGGGFTSGPAATSISIIGSRQPTLSTRWKRTRRSGTRRPGRRCSRSTRFTRTVLPAMWCCGTIAWGTGRAITGRARCDRRYCTTSAGPISILFRTSRRRMTCGGTGLESTEGSAESP